jgi:hypothetical protein
MYDVRGLMNTLQTMVRKKKAEKVAQNLVWHARDVNVNRAGEDPDMIKPVDDEKGNNDANEGE